MPAASAYTVSTDPAQLDLELIHRFLSQESYWAPNVPLAVVQRAIANSLCLGLYQGQRQVGLARVITDKATFAYLADRRSHCRRRCVAASNIRTGSPSNS